MEDGYLEYQGGLCDQLVPRQYNASMAGNPGNQAMSPHAVFYM